MTAPIDTDLIARLERCDETLATLAGSAPAALLIRASGAGAGAPRELTETGRWLLQLLKARQAMQQAAQATTLSEDALRRDQKFAPPGRPSLHIVQLRQRQAAAQQAARRARQALAQAAAGFVRSAGLPLPPRTTPVAFAERWLAAHMPKRPD